MGLIGIVGRGPDEGWMSEFALYVSRRTLHEGKLVRRSLSARSKFYEPYRNFLCREFFSYFLEF